MADNSPVYVVVVEASPTVRGQLVALLEAASGIHVLGAGADGEEALRLVKRLKPDVVLLDARLPKLDGLEVTRRIMREMPTRVVITAHKALHADTNLSFEAIRAGALTVVRKPEPGEPGVLEELLGTVRLMAGVPVVHHWGRHEAPAPAKVTRETQSKAGGSPNPPWRERDIKIVGIASSTGGPTALATVLGALPEFFPLPILVVQHIAIGFASGLAEWLATKTALTVAVAEQGCYPARGKVLIAPDDWHLQIDRSGAVVLTQAPPYKGLRPSANLLFSSLADVFGAAAMGIILTGMGDDGVDGLAALHVKGGTVIAQDEDTSVVYGMPQQAVRRGVVDDVLALDLIALTLADWRNPEKVGIL